MDFQPTEDQKALVEGLHRFCAEKMAPDRLPELEKSGGFDRSLWLDLAQMGVFALRLSEAET